MSVILILLGVSLAIAGGFLIAFFWSVHDGQFDDTYAPSHRILFENDNKPQDAEDSKKTAVQKQ